MVTINVILNNDQRPISALDFAYALTNHRQELKFDKAVSQSAARIQMMSHYMTKPYETLPCPSDFHDPLLDPFTFPFN